MEKLKINLEEYVTVLEIEENDNFDYNVLTDDEKKELDEVNEKKLQEALDKVVTSLADASEGKMPEGFDPSEYGFGK